MSQAILSVLALTASPSALEADPLARHLRIELLHLDLSQCTRCLDSGKRLEEALSLLAPILKETGWTTSLKKIHVTSEEQAQELLFASSPTVRINGRDIQLDSRETPCGDCDGICGEAGVQCREWRYRDGWFTSPPRALFVEAILGAMHAPAREVPAICCDQAERGFVVPENLRRFFAAKKKSAGASPCCAPPKNEAPAPQACCEPSSGCCGTGK